MFDTASFNSQNFWSVPGEHFRDAWYHAAVKDCADGLWDWNVAKGQLYISPKLQDLVGYTDEDVREKAYAWWAQRVYPEDYREMCRKMEEARQLKSEFIYFDAVRFLCKNGEYVWVENHAKILWGQDGEIIRMAGIIANVTPQKFIQSQLISVISGQAKEARNKIRFLSALNHEIRSPLSGMIGMMALLKETNLTEEQTHYVDNISNSTEMILSIVNDVLDASKIRSGKFTFEKIRFSLVKVLKSSADVIRPSLIKKNIAFQTFINERLPDFWVGDPTRLQQILVNLLGNAAKFTSQGSVTLRVNEEPSGEGENPLVTHVRFEISDTGIGIAPEAQGALFEDFTQADSSISRMYGGTGLGLSICKELVHLMGGQIGVKSEPGRGSAFWFTIPFEKAERFEDIAPVLENLPDAPLADQQGKRKLSILVAEDNQVNQEVMHGLLRLLGDDVTLANNGEEAVHVFKEKKFDVVLMDLNMPVLDGLGATGAIRALPNGNVPIIAVTASLFPEDQEKCHQQGITRVLLKPVNKASLEEALRPYRLQTPLVSRLAAESSREEGAAETAFDKKTLKALMEDLGQEKVIRLLDVYRHDALDLVEKIRRSAPQDSQNYAHTLAGMSENLGAHWVGKIARDIMGATQQAPEKLPLLIEDLERHFTDSLAEIQEIERMVE